MPLKGIHYELDHPVVASVILSNLLLDAAKMNRALVVIQPESSDEDLLSLARGTLFPSSALRQSPEAAAHMQGGQSLPPHHEELIAALCTAFKEVCRRAYSYGNSRISA